MNNHNKYNILFLCLILVTVLSSCTKTVVKSSDIANKITRLYRDSNQVKSDLMIEEQIKDSIDNEKSDFLNRNNLADFAYYDVKVMEGRVMLTGVAFDSKTKTFLANKVMNNLKVRSLLNEIVVKEKKSLFSTKISDYFLEKNIHMKIFFKSKIKSLNYEVSVVDSIAYVIGIAEDQEELELLLNLISTIRGIEKVVSHVITIDSKLKLKIEYI